jgi:hypothetical protein
MASSSLRLQRRHSRLTFIHLAGLSCKVSHTELGALSRAKLRTCHTILGKCWGSGAPSARFRPSTMQSREADGSTSPPRQRSYCNHREDKRPARPAPFALRCCERRNAFDLGRVPWAKKKNPAERYLLETGRLAVGDDPATVWAHECIRDGSSRRRTRQRLSKIVAPNRSGCQQTIPIITRIALSIKQPASVDWFVRE